jgi:predicted CopG family antitoxin
MKELYEEILQAAKNGDKSLADILARMIKAELDSLNQ